jgi:hypothetical protein
MIFWGTVFASNVLGANIVQNPGFETGNSNGWTTGGSNLVCMTGTVIFGVPCLVNSGMFAYNSDRLLAQTLDTVAGQTYTLSFSFATEIDNVGPGTPQDENNTFEVLFGGNTVFGPLTNVHQPTYEEVTISGLTATGASTGLSFQMTNGPGAFWLDDISVSPVPEPGSLAVVAAGLGTLWLRQRRTRPTYK